MGLNPALHGFVVGLKTAPPQRPHTRHHGRWPVSGPCCRLWRPSGHAAAAAPRLLPAVIQVGGHYRNPAPAPNPRKPVTTLTRIPPPRSRLSLSSLLRSRPLNTVAASETMTIPAKITRRMVLSVLTWSEAVRSRYCSGPNGSRTLVLSRMSIGRSSPYSDFTPRRAPCRW